mmetsp:Transcript_18028/g.38722  ORF Transcript_18028/g.38722 Transcript_18028/m.38722 type:complete len:222 (-) Transcript_18028:179-844(-)
MTEFDEARWQLEPVQRNILLTADEALLADSEKWGWRAPSPMGHRRTSDMNGMFFSDSWQPSQVKLSQPIYYVQKSPRTAQALSRTASCILPMVEPDASERGANDEGTDEASDQDAIIALLALQSEHLPPPTAGQVLNQRLQESATRETSHAASFSLKYDTSLQSAICKSSDNAIRFYCRFPGCGRGYASTDAVRKHCRQRHLEWLRRLGHGTPALYCQWDS